MKWIENDHPNDFWVGTEPRYKWVRKRDHLPPLGVTTGQSDPLCRVKLFLPESKRVWYLLEYDADTRLAYVLLKDPVSYLTRVSLERLAETGLDIQRDLLFSPLPLSNVWADRHVTA